MGIFPCAHPKKSRDVGHERKLIIFSSMSDGGDGDFNELSWGHFYYKYVNEGYVESRVRTCVENWSLVLIFLVVFLGSHIIKPHRLRQYVVQQACFLAIFRQLGINEMPSS